MGAFSLSNAPTQGAMVFVDGSNLLIQLGSELGLHIRADRPTADEISLATQIVNKAVNDSIVTGSFLGAYRVARKYWFGSVQGSDDDLLTRQTWLRQHRYEGVLFHKRKGRGEKGVDLAVAREMLMHGYNRNYEMAVLVAGDEDYLGLVQDLKRLGRLVVLAFFGTAGSLSPRLRVACDAFIDLPQPMAAAPELTARMKAEGGA